jgi:hypothetical protein
VNFFATAPPNIFVEREDRHYRQAVRYCAYLVRDIEQNDSLATPLEGSFISRERRKVARAIAKLAALLRDGPRADTAAFQSMLASLNEAQQQLAKLVESDNDSDDWEYEE